MDNRCRVADLRVAFWDVKPTHLAVAVLLLAPLGLLAAATLITTAAGGAATTAAAGAAAACAYGQPDAARAAEALEYITPGLRTLVTASHWAEFAPPLGSGEVPSATDGSTAVAASSYRSASDPQLREILRFGVRRLLAEPGANVATVPLQWWFGEMPPEFDHTWPEEPIVELGRAAGEYVDEYLVAYLNAQSDAEHRCVPRHSSACLQPFDIDAALATVRRLESGNDYAESHRSRAVGGPTGSGWPSGAYQYLRSSWDQFGGFDEAFQAPPSVQDARARADVAAIIDEYGDPAWIPLSWYVGPAGAKAIADGHRDPTVVPNPEHNSISPADYQERWLEHYTTVALPASGVQPAVCPHGAAAVVAWAETQLGAPYAGTDCCRFGTPWPGGTITSYHDPDRSYTFPDGTVTYDCSGFVVAAYLAASGVDLRQWGLYGSQAMGSSNDLTDVAVGDLLPGDLVVYSPDPTSGIGHVGMYHHAEGGTALMIHSSPSKGVNISPIDWARVSAIKRVAVHVPG